MKHYWKYIGLVLITVFLYSGSAFAQHVNADTDRANEDLEWLEEDEEVTPTGNNQPSQQVINRSGNGGNSTGNGYTAPVQSGNTGQKTYSSTRSRRVVNVDPGHYLVNVKSWLNVRKARSASSQQVGRLKAQTPVEVTNCDRGWAYIKSAEISGYVNAAYLTPYTPVANDESEQIGKGFSLKGQWWQIGIGIGLIIIAITGYHFSQNYEYEAAYGWTMVSGAILIICMLFMPDNYLIREWYAGHWPGLLVGAMGWTAAIASNIIVWNKWWYEETSEYHATWMAWIVAVLVAGGIEFLDFALWIKLVVGFFFIGGYHGLFVKSDNGQGALMHIVAGVSTAMTAMSLIPLFI